MSKPCKRCGGGGTEPVKVETVKPERGWRRTWAVAVPVNEQEHGAETLDGLLQAVAAGPIGVALGYDARTPRYFLLVAVLHEAART